MFIDHSQSNLSMAMKQSTFHNDYNTPLTQSQFGTQSIYS